MVSLSLSSLLDLCSMRIAYLMWTRHDVTKCCSNEHQWKSLGDVVLREVQSLPLPEQVKPLILKLVKPAGEHLLFLLSLWLSKTQYMHKEKWLPPDMFFECITLNGHGLINHSKTAEKILNSRMLHNVFAFRLACVNFLEVEVLKLWPHVMQYFLNKITLQGEHSPKIKEEFFFPKLSGKVDWYNCPIVHPSNDLKTYFNFECDFYPPYTEEPHEVLFWISWCLSVQNATDFQATPQCIKSEVWHELILDSAISSGNFAYFQFYKKYRKKVIICDYEKLLKNFWFSEGYPTSFVYFYMMLNSEARLELFEEWPRETLLHFFHWPLSLTLVEKTEEIWNLICDGEKKWIFLKLFSLLFERNSTMIRYLHSIRDFWRGNSRHCLMSDLEIPGLQINDHLISIFINLWKISSDILKSRVLNSCVFSNPRRRSYRYRPFQLKFETTELKQKLLELFLVKVEAVLELSKGENTKESFRRIVEKYWSPYFEDLDERCIAFLHEESSEMDTDLRGRRRHVWGRIHRKISGTVTRYEIKEKFRNYVKEYLFLSNTNNSSFFYR